MDASSFVRFFRSLPATRSRWSPLRPDARDGRKIPMSSHFLALPLALALVSLAVGPTSAIGDGSGRTLPLADATCRSLIEQGGR